MTAGNKVELNLGFLENMIAYQIRLAQIAAYKDFETVTTGFGQAPRYFGLLSLIEANPGMSQSRLAEEIHLGRSSLVSIVDKLTSENIVERREVGGDRRRHALWLTTKGKKTLERLKPHVAAHEKRLTEGMSSAERKLFLCMLQTIDANMRGPRRHAEVA